MRIQFLGGVLLFAGSSFAQGDLAKNLDFALGKVRARMPVEAYLELARLQPKLLAKLAPVLRASLPAPPKGWKLDGVGHTVYNTNQVEAYFMPPGTKRWEKPRIHVAMHCFVTDRELADLAGKLPADGKRRPDEVHVMLGKTPAIFQDFKVRTVLTTLVGRSKLTFFGEDVKRDRLLAFAKGMKIDRLLEGFEGGKADAAEAALIETKQLLAKDKHGAAARNVYAAFVGMRKQAAGVLKPILPSAPTGWTLGFPRELPHSIAYGTQVMDAVYATGDKFDLRYIRKPHVRIEVHLDDSPETARLRGDLGRDRLGRGVEKLKIAGQDALLRARGDQFIIRMPAGDGAMLKVSSRKVERARVLAIANRIAVAKMATLISASAAESAERDIAENTSNLIQAIESAVAAAKADKPILAYRHVAAARKQAILETAKRLEPILPAGPDGWALVHCGPNALVGVVVEAAWAPKGKKRVDTPNLILSTTLAFPESLSKTLRKMIDGGEPLGAGMERIEYGERKALFSSAGGRNSLQFLLGDSSMTLQGSGADKSTLTAFAKTLPLDKIAVLLGDAKADEALAQLGEAKTLVASGTLGAAVVNLHRAAITLRYRAGQPLKAVLPAAPDAWNRVFLQENQRGRMRSGGMHVLEATYEKPGHRGGVLKKDPEMTLEIHLEDSPMVARAWSELNSSRPRKNLERIRVAGKESLLNKNGEDMTLVIPISRRVVVRAQSQKLTPAELLAIASKVDVAKLEKMANVE